MARTKAIDSRCVLKRKSHAEISTFYAVSGNYAQGNYAQGNYAQGNYAQENYAQGNYAQTEITPKRKLRPNVIYAQGNYGNVISYAHILLVP